MKLFESERHVMEVLWEKGPLPAGEIARELTGRIGWNRNTTYTIIKRCIEKGAVQRQEPGFLCRALVTRDETQREEMTELIDKRFGGSNAAFLSAFFDGRTLSSEEIDQLRRLVEELR